MKKKIILMITAFVLVSLCFIYYQNNNPEVTEINSNQTGNNSINNSKAISDYIDEQIKNINIDDIEKKDKELRKEYEKSKDYLLNKSYTEFEFHNGSGIIAEYLYNLFYLDFEKYKIETDLLIEYVGNCPNGHYEIFSPPYSMNISYENFDKITINHDYITKQENLLWIIDILKKELDYTNKSNAVNKNSDLSSICASLAQIYLYMNEDDMVKYYDDLDKHYQELLQEDIKKYIE